MTDQNPHNYDSAKTSIRDLLHYIQKLRQALGNARIDPPADNGVVRRACSVVDWDTPKFSGPTKTSSDFRAELETELKSLNLKDFLKPL